MRETTGRGKYAGAENGFEAASDGADGEPYAGGGLGAARPDRHGDSGSGRRGVSAVKRAALFEKRAV